MVLSPKDTERNRDKRTQLLQDTVHGEQGFQDTVSQNTEGKDTVGEEAVAGGYRVCHRAVQGLQNTEMRTVAMRYRAIYRDARDSGYRGNKIHLTT